MEKKGGTEDQGRATRHQEEMRLDDGDTGPCDPLNVQNGVRQASLYLFPFFAAFSSLQGCQRKFCHTARVV